MKKGSLNLSIQAIVILVMAMAVLGLGLSFVRTLFDEAGGGLMKALDNTDLPNPATADVPITLPSTITVKEGTQTTFDVGLYNKENPEDKSLVFIGDTDNCPIVAPASFDSTTSDALSFDSVTQYIGSGEAAGYRVVVSAGKGVGSPDKLNSQGSPYICTVSGAGQSKQFYVNIGE